MTFYYNSSVVLPDGTRGCLKDLKVGAEVLGVDNQGMVTPAEVTKIVPNEMTENWLNIRTTRHETALGSSYFSLIATADQEIAVEGEGFKPLLEVEEGMLIKGTTSTLNLDHVQKSALIGILLGDGSIHKGKNEASSWALRWSHSEKQEAYMKWTVQVLGSLAQLGKEDASGYGSRMLTARTSHHPDIRKLFEGFDKPGGILPEEVEQMINPISLLFWYLDDGSLTHAPGQQDRASFATYSFSDNAIALLKKGLLRLGIDSTIQDSPKGKTLRLNYKEARMMFTMIAPMVPPSMQYKLPADLRGGSGWFPKPHMVPGYRTTPLRVLATSGIHRYERKAPSMPKNLRSRSWEVQTSTGNMYVNGMLLRA